jgi:hypothetical protein
MTDSQSEPSRQFWALLAYSPLSGAATTCVGVIGVDRSADPTDIVVEEFAALMHTAGGGWAERLATTTGRGELSPETIAMWQDTANGITWDIAEMDDDNPGGTLRQALDVLSDEILTHPDVDQRLLSRATTVA